MNLLRAAIREPLLHFVLIGALLFAFTAVRQKQEHAEIRITAGEIAQLAAFWETQAQRKPSADELRALIEERIDEEVLAREAVRLGLDRDDVIVRRHLAQKMAFVNDDLAVVAEPAESELRAHFDAHQQAYTTPDLYALRHVFFNPDRRGMALDADAQRALQRLARGANANEIGDPFMLPRELADVSRDDIARDFGSIFADAATTSKPGTWAGPVRSPFGVHLVKLESHTPGSVARFEDVRDRVREALLSQKRQEANAALRANLRQQYRIVIETAEGSGS